MRGILSFIQTNRFVSGSNFPEATPVSEEQINEALRRIWKETGTTPEQTLVAGDIFELDLALPAALGAHVQLVARDNAMAYELNAVKALGPRGGVDRSLRALLPRLK